MEELRNILEQGSEVKLFLQGKDFRKESISIEFHEKYMDFYAQWERLLRVRYAGIENIGYERIFRIQILTFTYGRQNVALQIK